MELRRRQKTSRAIAACGRKGHQWREMSPPRCRRCGLHLTTTGPHWQHRHNESPWIKP